MLKTINNWYSNLYYRLLIAIWDKFSNSQHWELIKFVFNIMMLKKQWYDKIETEYSRVNLSHVMEFNIKQVREDLKNLEREMRHRRHLNIASRHIKSGKDSNLKYNIKTLYRVTFIVQRKVINTNGIILNKVQEINKRLLFVKVGSNDTVLNIPIPKQSMKKLRENLTLSMFKYLNNKVTFKNYKNLEEGKDRIFLEIDTVEELKQAEKMLNRFFKNRTEKKTKYSKRKFGKEETVLNIQDVWSADLNMVELEHLINKLNRVNHDMSHQVLTFEDLIS